MSDRHARCWNSFVDADVFVTARVDMSQILNKSDVMIKLEVRIWIDDIVWLFGSLVERTTVEVAEVERVIAYLNTCISLSLDRPTFVNPPK